MSLPLTCGEALTSFWDYKEQEDFCYFKKSNGSLLSSSLFKKESHQPYLPHRFSESSSLSPPGAVQIRQRDQLVGCRGFFLAGRKYWDELERDFLNSKDFFLSFSSPSSSPVAPALLSGSVSPSPDAVARPPRGLWLRPPPSEKRKNFKYVVVMYM